MSGIYAGSTPKYLTRIKDENGTQLDPSDINQVIDVFIWIFNILDGSIIAKFYLNIAPSPIGTWRQASIKEVEQGDKRVLFFLTSAETIAAKGNQNGIQIKIIIPDSDLPPIDERIIIKKGRFTEIESAIS